MIIKSSFKDFYDCGMQLGYGGPVYIREKSYVDTDIIVPRHSSWWNNDVKNKKKYDSDCTPFLLSICGKLYPGIHSEQFVEEWDNQIFKWNRSVVQNETYYSVDQIQSGYHYETYKDLFNLRYKRFYTDKETHPYKPTDDLHEQLRCPILKITTGKDNNYQDKSQITLNPNLSEINFHQIMGPLEVFQLIEMWFSNLTSPERPIPAISNSDMIEAKGFDLKTSFRKEKK